MDQPQLTPFQRIKIQMELAVPLIRTLQDELGAQVVLDALRKRYNDQRMAARGACTKLRPPRLDILKRDFDHFKSGNVLDYDVVSADDDRVEIHVTRCQYADLMRDLGASELGDLLICSEDYVMADRAGLQLERTQTRMMGGSHCDFCYAKGRDQSVS
ncbi:MAG: L-2-amino-thiazoline-4-carboxylic acid hydrolase [Pseudomonadota bacterium]